MPLPLVHLPTFGQADKVHPPRVLMGVLNNARSYLCLGTLTRVPPPNYNRNSKPISFSCSLKIFSDPFGKPTLLYFEILIMWIKTLNMFLVCRWHYLNLIWGEGPILCLPSGHDYWQCEQYSLGDGHNHWGSFFSCIGLITGSVVWEKVCDLSSNYWLACLLSVLLCVAFAKFYQISVIDLTNLSWNFW